MSSIRMSENRTSHLSLQHEIVLVDLSGTWASYGARHTSSLAPSRAPEAAASGVFYQCQRHPSAGCMR